MIIFRLCPGRCRLLASHLRRSKVTPPAHTSAPCSTSVQTPAYALLWCPAFTQQWRQPAPSWWSYGRSGGALPAADCRLCEASDLATKLEWQTEHRKRRRVPDSALSGHHSSADWLQGAKWECALKEAEASGLQYPSVVTRILPSPLTLVSWQCPSLRDVLISILRKRIKVGGGGGGGGGEQLGWGVKKKNTGGKDWLQWTSYGAFNPFSAMRLSDVLSNVFSDSLESCVPHLHCHSKAWKRHLTSTTVFSLARQHVSK